MVIQESNKTERVRLRLVNNMAVKVGLSAAIAAMPMTLQAQSQTAQDSRSNDRAVSQNASGEAVLETVTISGAEGQINTNSATTASSRLPGTVRDIPQIVNTIPERLLIEQNVTTLQQALRNVPGITASTGEGGGGMTGDRFRIRGFEALGDEYRDGLRDMGVYVRDSFNMEQIQVFKGPNGENFGVGSTGGAINMRSKQARLGTFGSVDFSIGTGTLYRSTFDYNHQFNETSAARINIMGNWQDFADRDHVKSDRWGIALSAGFGLGTEQTWHIDYMYQHNNAVPDYGVPFVITPSGLSRPVTEFGVPRSTFYGKDSDRDKSDVHMITSSYSREVNDWLTIKNDTRYTNFSRWFSPTNVNCNVTLNGANLCTQSLFGSGGDPMLRAGAGGGNSYDQRSWGIQNVTTALLKFETGKLRHEAIVGLDVNYEKDRRYGLKYVIPGTDRDARKADFFPTLWHENTDSSYYDIVRDNQDLREPKNHAYAIFVSDRVWFTDELSLLAGVRWDHQKINIDGLNSRGEFGYSVKSSYASPKASLIWEPNKSQTYYLTYSVSNNLPWGQNVTSGFTSSGGFTRTYWKPEKSELYELGTKLDFLNGRLGLTGAVFQVTKDNALHNEPDGSVRFSGEKQRVRGFELGATGEVTPQWLVYASYSFLKSEVLDGAPSTSIGFDGRVIGTSYIGGAVAGVPKNSASLWTTYNLAPHFDALDGNLIIGGGMTYRDAMPTRSDQMASIPHSFSLDGVLSYETEKWNLSLNAYNLTDRLNYDTYFFGNRATPSAGRTFVLKVGTKF